MQSLPLLSSLAVCSIAVPRRRNPSLSHLHLLRSRRPSQSRFSANSPELQPVPVYIAEISPKSLRGRLGALNQLAVTVGVMLVYLFGIFLGWRILSVLGILSCGALIPGLFFIPESPRWLAKMGKLEEAELSLLVLRGFSSDITIEMEEIKCMVIGFSLGLGLVPWLIMSEILPVNIKGLGGSAATMANFLMSWVVTLTANMMLAWNA